MKIEDLPVYKAKKVDSDEKKEILSKLTKARILG